ncbi:MAG: hypothetical protein JKY95_07920 [Planctomycetaceae bacterium]|nr:hypothetical protein [Planctomycetaceae bacterium]
MELTIGVLQNTALIFSVCASAYSLFSILKDKPIIDVKILDVKRDGDLIAVKLFFQNSGKNMTTATDYIIELGEQTQKGLQIDEKKIYPTGNHSISRTSPKYVEAYPLELPQGKACHFNVIFNIDSPTHTKAKLKINLINHKSKMLILEMPCTAT